jgi:WD40 repeat protein
MATTTGSSEDPLPKAGADVFVSYSRADRASVVALTDGLAARGKRAWVDLEDIPPSAEWMSEIRTAIDAADGYLVVISPDFANSSICAQELEHALDAGKRIVPFLVRPTDPATVPPSLAALNWIDATDPGNDAALDAVIVALDTDLERVRSHTKLLVRAAEWGKTDEDRSLLLRGRELSAAESLVSGPDQEPRPTQLQTRFVLSSRRASGRRQRGAIAIVTAMLLVAASLSVVAVTERNASNRNEHVAELRAAESRSRELASASIDQIGTDPERSLLLATEAMRSAATPEALAALRTSLTDSHVRATLTGHENVVSSVSYSSDGKKLLTASFDGTARIWDLTVTPSTSVALSGHHDIIESAVFNHDASRAVTASFDGTARVWNVGTGANVATLAGHTGAVHEAIFSPDGSLTLTAGDDGTARLWNAQTGTQLHVFVDGARPIYHASFSPDGSLILTAGDDGARLWDVASGRLLHAAGDGALLAASFDASGQRAATAGRDGVVRLWDVASGRRVAVLRGHQGSVVSVGFSPDGRTVVSASEDGTARLWEASSGRSVQVLRGHRSGLVEASFSPDGRYVVTAGDDGTARIWDVAKGALLSTLSGHEGAVMAATFSPDGSRVATAGADGTARIWSPLSGEDLIAESVVSSSMDAHATKFAVGTDAGDISIFDAATGRTLRTIHSEAGLTTVSLSGDGTMVGAGGFDGVGRVWDTGSGTLITQLRGHAKGVWMAADFYQANDRIVTWSDDGTARLWNPRTGAQLDVFRHDADPNTAGIWEAYLSPDGATVVTTGLVDQRVRVWDGSTGRQRWSAEHLGGSGGVGGGISYDGRYLLTAAGQATIRNLATGEKVSVLQTPVKILGGDITLDGSRVAGRSDDGTVRIFDTETGALLSEVPSTGAALNSVGFSSDGRSVVTASDDGLVRVSDVPSGALVATYGGGSGPASSARFAQGDRVVLTAAANGARIDRCEVCGSTDELLSLAASRTTRTLTEVERVEFLGVAPATSSTPQRDGLETTQGVPVTDGLLGAGSYRTVGVDPTITFRLDDGWQGSSTLDREQEGQGVVATFVQLQRLDVPTDGMSFLFLSPGRVLDGRLDWDDRRNVRPFPQDLGAWLAMQPDLRTSHRTTRRIGGVDGASVDTLVMSVPDNPWPVCGGCVTLVAGTLTNPTGPITDHDFINALGPGEVDRWIVLDIGSNKVLVNAYAASADEFRRFIPIIDGVLGSVRIEV